MTTRFGGGGLSIGSEMSGGVEGVRVEGVRLLHGSYGISVKTGQTRGGFVRDVSISDVEVVGAWKARTPARTPPRPPAEVAPSNRAVSGFRVAAAPTRPRRCGPDPVPRACGSQNAIRIDAFYGMPNTICPDGPDGRPARVPSVVDGIRLERVRVHNANLSVHLAGARDVPTTRVSFHNVSFSCDNPLWCSDAHLRPECFGGVSGWAEGVEGLPSGFGDACGIVANTTTAKATLQVEERRKLL